MDLGAFYVQRRYRDADGYEVREYELFEQSGLTQNKKTKEFDFAKSCERVQGGRFELPPNSFH